jgi:ankyrin repeat protein/cell wall assembly regulator SMI1
MLSRRNVLWGLGGFSWISSTLVAAAKDQVTVTPELWQAWTTELQTMQAHVLRRAWHLVPLEIDPPATEAEIQRVEIKYGLRVPAQLREILLLHSARVRFGWSIPSLMQPFEGLNLPTSGGLRDGLWSLDHIERKAIVSFNSLRENVAKLGDGEEPNTPEMWDNQFPFAAVGSGDTLTIDMSAPQGPQPVRYFSSDREGLHHHIIAPDFVAFITAYTRLGCAGSDHDDWFRFIARGDSDLRYLDPDGDGGRRWRTWLERDPHQREVDEPPEPVPAKTRSDFNLLDAARDGSAWGIEAAMAAGAALDCVDGSEPNREGLYDITYETALVYAVRRGDLGTIERLLNAGASVDTRLLSLSEAIRYSTVEVVRWLLSRGARVNAWKGDRYGPLHVLLVQPANKRPGGKASIMPILEALLTAGADPNARFDGARTLLMWCAPEVIKLLLEHGADPKLTDYSGNTALHVTRSLEAIRLLTAHGADANALTKPPSSGGGSLVAPHTPYQAQLQAAPYQTQMQRTSAGLSDDTDAILNTLVAVGADPLKRDGWGRSTLWYCRYVADASRLVGLGLDPKERDPDGETLLHWIIRSYGAGFARNASAVVLFKYYQALGVDINATDKSGTTVLHLAARWSTKEDVALLLTRGADKTARDKYGRLPVDRVPRSSQEVRELLRI